MDEDPAVADRLTRHSSRGADRHQSHRIGSKTAWEQVVVRHGPAVLRYLRDAVGNPSEAESLWREFSGTVLLGELSREPVPPGPFRDLLRTPSIRLVEAHRRAGLRGADHRMIDDGPAGEDPEAARFDAIWRQELLDRSWARLQALEDRTGQPYCTTLRCLVDTPGLSSTELAERIGQLLGRTVSAPNARQLLHRARAEFSKLLLDEVVATLPAGAPFARVERELIETGLLAFCREAVGRARPTSGRQR